MAVTLVMSSTPVVAAAAASDALEPSTAQALGVAEYSFFIGAEITGALLLAATGLLAIARQSSRAGSVGRVSSSPINVLNGYVVAKADELGIPAPVNQAVVRLVQAFDSGDSGSRDAIRDQLNAVFDELSG